VRVLLQRVTHASVTVADERIAQIGRGLLALVGVFPGDGAAEVRFLADKTLGLRIFPEPGSDDGTMNASLLDLSAEDLSAELLVVSQFTLAADTSRGRRPGFSTAAAPDVAERIYNEFVAAVSDRGVRVATGQFGANMCIDLTNDGPVTLLLEK